MSTLPKPPPPCFNLHFSCRTVTPLMTPKAGYDQKSGEKPGWKLDCILETVGSIDAWARERWRCTTARAHTHTHTHTHTHIHTHTHTYIHTHTHKHTYTHTHTHTHVHKYTQTQMEPRLHTAHLARSEVLSIVLFARSFYKPCRHQRGGDGKHSNRQLEDRDEDVYSTRYSNESRTPLCAQRPPEQQHQQ
jgi:hypothetical protein